MANIMVKRLRRMTIGQNSIKQKPFVRNDMSSSESQIVCHRGNNIFPVSLMMGHFRGLSSPADAMGGLTIRRIIILLLLVPQIAQTKVAKSKDATITPRFSHHQLSNFTSRVGNDVSFDCSVENLGQSKIAWLHSEKGTLAVYPHVITQNDRISVSSDHRNTYNLKLRDIRESDAGVYICQINTAPVISISGALAVVVPPDIIDEESSSDTLATEGMRVSLTCRAKGNPTPAIAWRREDGKNIRLCHKDARNGGHDRRDRDCREVSIHYGTELELPHVSRFDSGIYLCIASNGVQPSVSKIVRLFVDFPPTLWISHQLIGSEVGNSAQLECLTAAHPPSLNFWSRDGGKTYILPREGKYEFVTVNGDPSFYNILMKLRIQNVTEADYGKYFCLAKNSQGETSGEIALYEVEKPSTTTQAFFSDYDVRTEESEVDESNQTSAVFLNVPNSNPEDGEEKKNRGKPNNNSSTNNNNNGKKGQRKNSRKNSENEEREELDRLMSSGTHSKMSTLIWISTTIMLLQFS